MGTGGVTKVALVLKRGASAALSQKRSRGCWFSWWVSEREAASPPRASGAGASSCPGSSFCKMERVVLCLHVAPWPGFPGKALSAPPAGSVAAHTLLCFVSVLGGFGHLSVQRGVYAHSPLGCLEPLAGSQLWEGDLTSAGWDPAQPLPLSGLQGAPSWHEL